MDDENVYGPELYRLGFSEAVSKNLLCDYKVIVLAVSEEHVSRAIQSQLTGKAELNLDDAVKIIGCWNGLSRKFLNTENGSASSNGKKKPTIFMKRAVAFTTTIKKSKGFRDYFSRIVDDYLTRFPDKHALKCEVRHVDGTQNALARNESLTWLKEEHEDKEP